MPLSLCCPSGHNKPEAEKRSRGSAAGLSERGGHYPEPGAGSWVNPEGGTAALAWVSGMTGCCVQSAGFAYARRLVDE